MVIYQATETQNERLLDALKLEDAVESVIRLNYEVSTMLHQKLIENLFEDKAFIAVLKG